MGYTITVPNIGQVFYRDEEAWTNHTVEAIEQNDEAVISVYEGGGYTDETLEEMKADDASDKELADYIRNTDDFREALDSFCPIYDILHVLQNNHIPEGALIRLLDTAPNVAILQDPEGGYFISLTCCGTDCTDEIKAAYLAIDFNSPIG